MANSFAKKITKGEQGSENGQKSLSVQHASKGILSCFSLETSLT
jgi:hypothetical protein